MPQPKVAVISTMKNEAESIRGFLDGLLAQSRSPDEIVLVDGGSIDGTVEIIRSYLEQGAPIRLLVEPGANRSRGRNLAIESAEAEIVAVTDCGCRPERDWLEKLMAPFESEDPPDVVSGFYRPEAKTMMEQAVAAVTVPGVGEIDPATFLPSSRSVAFRREAWQQVGGYPEWANWNEDTPFDLALRKAGFRFQFSPQAIVRWQVQGKLRAVFRQFFRYARGDGEAGTWFGHYTKAYLEFCICVALFLLGWRWPGCWAGLVGLIALYGMWNFRKACRRGAGFSPSLLAPLVMGAVDLAHLIGYSVGWMTRRKK